MIIYLKVNVTVFTIVYIVFLLFHSTVCEKKELNSALKSAEDLFRRLYKLERAEQAAAIKALLKLGTEIKQSKMIEAIAEKVFNVIKKSRLILENADYIPGESSFPTDEKIRDALSNVLENTAFLGDIILRLPDLSQRVILNNTEWNELYKWSLIFSNNSLLIDKKTSALLTLVEQEMNYTFRKPDFVNPHRKVKLQPPEEIQEVTKSVKKKKTLPKGPRLSVRQFGEL